jgi:hypothetical protein
MRDLCKGKEYVGFEALTTVATKFPIFWVLTRCNFPYHQRFGGTCYLHLHDIYHCVYLTLKFTVANSKFHYSSRNMHRMSEEPALVA